ncbi:hypothetical protein GF327_00895 [Candidatus Woesearchaeota archaeon]|nr:hypothetical protein [Candidatus Woesearchaeota archaeon]
MKVLAFSDIHGNLEILKLLQEKSKIAEINICAGDISSMSRNLIILMKRLNSLKNKTLLIPGNHENEDELKAASKNFENILFLHKGVHIINKNIFMGYGGGGFSMNDDGFSLVADNFFKKQSLSEMKRSVLVTHAPPFKTGLDKIMGEHRGNKSIRKFIDETSPHLAISGHFHENAGKTDQIGKTLLMNPGPKGMFVNL